MHSCEFSFVPTYPSAQTTAIVAWYRLVELFTLKISIYKTAIFFGIRLVSRSLSSTPNNNGDQR